MKTTNDVNGVMDGAKIAVKVHYVGADGIGRQVKTVWRRASRYRRERNNRDRETVLVRIDGSDVWAERYSGTVWTVELRAPEVTTAPVDASGVLVWTKADVGCYWNSGPYTIATRTTVEHGARNSDYVVVFERNEIGAAGTLDGAQHLAQCAHNFRMLKGAK